MADTVSKNKRSEIMSRIGSRDTRLEAGFRKKLWQKGVRYRKNPKGYFGNPDLAVKKHKLIVFIDSCFWHGCKRHCRLPRTNRNYWINKIERNKRRDKQVSKHYKRSGWKVVRVWECDIKRDVAKAIQTIKTAIGVRD